MDAVRVRVRHSFFRNYLPWNRQWARQWAIIFDRLDSFSIAKISKKYSFRGCYFYEKRNVHFYLPLRDFMDKFTYQFEWSALGLTRETRIWARSLNLGKKSRFTKLAANSSGKYVEASVETLELWNRILE